MSKLTLKQKTFLQKGKGTSGHDVIALLAMTQQLCELFYQYFSFTFQKISSFKLKKNALKCIVLIAETNRTRNYPERKFDRGKSQKSCCTTISLQILFQQNKNQSFGI